MNSLNEWEKRYIDDVDICIRLLETLKEDYTAPGCYNMINASKVKRVRIMIHDLLKNH